MESFNRYRGRGAGQVNGDTCKKPKESSPPSEKEQMDVNSLTSLFCNAAAPKADAGTPELIFYCGGGV